MTEEQQRDCGDPQGTGGTLHVCFFSQDLSYGSGWGTYSASIVNGMLDRGMRCTVLAAEGACPMPPRGGLRQAAVLRSFANDRYKPLRMLRDYVRVRTWVAGCDLVHCLAEPVAPLAAMFARRARPLILQAVGTYAVAPLDHPLYGSLWRWAYARASHVPCISAYTQKRLLAKLPLRRTSVVPLGVDVSRFDGCFQSTRPPADEDDPWPVLLGVGAVKPRKGYHVAIQAVARIRERYPRVVYRIVGEAQRSSYRRELEALIGTLGLERHVELLGHVDEGQLLDHYARCDLLMLPLTNEEHAFDGFGLVYLEANACGKPVIGSLESGAETAICDGVSGLLVLQNDPGAAADAALCLLEDRDLYNRMATSARRWAEAMSWDRTVASLREIYERAVAHG